MQRTLKESQLLYWTQARLIKAASWETIYRALGIYMHIACELQEGLSIEFDAFLRHLQLLAADNSVLLMERDVAIRGLRKSPLTQGAPQHSLGIAPTREQSLKGLMWLQKKGEIYVCCPPGALAG